MRLVSFLLLLLTACGCSWTHPTAPPDFFDGAYPPVDAEVSNPLFVPINDREFVWNQVVDEIDNYFRIQREQRVRLVGHVLTEGRIDTFPTVGSTILEPWRRDSVPGFERLHATLQSIRRRAQVRVIPTAGGYVIEVAVIKELEDMLQPEHASVGNATMRHDTSPERNDEPPRNLAPGAIGWIRLGRDVALEQRILSNLRGRLNDDTPPIRLPAIPANLDVNARLPQ